MDTYSALRGKGGEGGRRQEQQGRQQRQSVDRSIKPRCPPSLPLLLVSLSRQSVDGGERGGQN